MRKHENGNATQRSDLALSASYERHVNNASEHFLVYLVKDITRGRLGPTAMKAIKEELHQEAN